MSTVLDVAHVTLSVSTKSQATSSRRILLIGNPNCGKTTLFNRLTGMRQRVGNFPGVTVEKKVGSLDLPDLHATVTDLPGCYSLSPHSEDEQVVLDSLLLPSGQGGPDLVIGVVDAQNLSRHLLLILQVIDLGLPLVLAVNRWDVLLKSGAHLDIQSLSTRLGVPVIAVSATQGIGIHDLTNAVQQALIAPHRPHPLEWPAFISGITNDLANAHQTETGLTAAGWRRLVFAHQHARSHQALITRQHLKTVIEKTQAAIQQQGYHPLAIETLHLRKLVRKLLDGILTVPPENQASVTRSIDRLLTHKVFGIGFFALVMLTMFFLLFVASEPLVGLLETVTENASGYVAGFESIPAWFRSLLTDGLISGVGGVLTFLPQIILLFFMIGLLEDSGYMSRAACVMDRWMSKCGLNGKSMVPMLSSFACAIPGIMATRTIEHPKTRLTTILVAPLISCSARLPVYTLLVGAVIVPRFGSAVGGLALFLLHILGLSLAFPAAWILNRKLFKSGQTPLILEMPDYSWPRPRDLFHRVYNSSLSFVQRAGTLIVLVSLIIWALVYFPLPETRAQIDTIDAARMENSYLGRMGRMIQPVFAPAGYDWKISVGILASFPAREVIVATMGVLYQNGNTDEDGESLSAALRSATWTQGPKTGQPVFTLPVAASLLVFIALCMQCSATLITIAKESQWKWALGSYALYSVFAWIGAVIVYQVLTAIGV